MQEQATSEILEGIYKQEILKLHIFTEKGNKHHIPRQSVILWCFFFFFKKA